MYRSGSRSPLRAFARRAVLLALAPAEHRGDVNRQLRPADQVGVVAYVRIVGVVDVYGEIARQALAFDKTPVRRAGRLVEGISG